MQRECRRAPAPESGPGSRTRRPPPATAAGGRELDRVGDRASGVDQDREVHARCRSPYDITFPVVVQGPGGGDEEWQTRVYT